MVYPEASETGPAHAPSQATSSMMDNALSALSPCPARKKTFETPELLESILLELDIQTLLVSAQRVSRQWHSLVGNSPALRKALFFEVDNLNKPQDVAIKWGDQPAQPPQGQPVRPIPNPLLIKAFPSWFRETQARWTLMATSHSDVDTDTDSEEDSDGSSDTSTSDGRGGFRWHFNSIGVDGDDDNDEDDESGDIIFPNQVNYGADPFTKKQGVFEYPTASWRRMLVYQSPPLRTIAVWARGVAEHGGSDCFWCTVYCVDGEQTKWRQGLVVRAVDRDPAGGAEDEAPSFGIRAKRSDGSGDDDSGTRNEDIDTGCVESPRLGDRGGNIIHPQSHPYKDAFESFEKWKLSDNKGGESSSNAARVAQGLRMGEYFNFTVYQACLKTNARKVAHWSWAMATGVPYLRKSSRGLGRHGPIPSEVKINWDEVASGVDLVLSSTYLDPEERSETESHQDDLHNIEWQGTLEGMKTLVARTGGLRKAWYWCKDYGVEMPDVGEDEEAEEDDEEG